MRTFKVFYHDNSGPKCEEFKGTEVRYENSWFILWKPAPDNIHNFLTRLVIAIPVDSIYSVEEIE